jgi:hypothetical protein
MSTHSGIECRYKILVEDINTHETQTYSAKNVITNVARDTAALMTLCSYVRCGSGAGVPAVTDTGLFAPLASAARAATPTVAPSGSNYWAGVPTTLPLLFIAAPYLANQEVGSTFSELAVMGSSTGNTSARTHAMITDEFGVPTSFVKTNTQTVTVQVCFFITVAYIHGDLFPYAQVYSVHRAPYSINGACNPLALTPSYNVLTNVAVELRVSAQGLWSNPGSVMTFDPNSIGSGRVLASSVLSDPAVTPNHLLHTIQLYLHSGASIDGVDWYNPTGSAMNTRLPISLPVNISRGISLGTAYNALRFVCWNINYDIEPILNVSDVRINNTSVPFTYYPATPMATLWHRYYTTTANQHVYIYRTTVQYSDNVRCYAWLSTTYDDQTVTIETSDDALSWTHVGGAWDVANGNLLGRYVRLTGTAPSNISYSTQYTLFQTCPGTWKSPLVRNTAPFIKLDSAINAPSGTEIMFDYESRGIVFDGTNSLRVGSSSFTYSTS